MTLHLTNITALHRYAMVRCDTGGDGYSLYAIVELRKGLTDRVLVNNVRYDAAKEITDALNLAYRMGE